MSASRSSPSTAAPESARRTLRARRRLRRAREQLAHLVIRGLREVVVDLTDGAKPVSDLEAHQLVDEPPSSSHTSRGATGTAMTSLSGSRARRASAATRIDAPVASPSSTRITMRPRTSVAARPLL